MTSQPSDRHKHLLIPCTASGDDLPQQAVQLAERLLRTARQEQTSTEQEQAARLARMMADPVGKELTIALVDQAFRSHHPDRIADQHAGIHGPGSNLKRRELLGEKAVAQVAQ